MSETSAESIEIEVVYALASHQEVVKLALPEGATVNDAINASGLLRKYPGIDPGGKNKLGIYAKPVKLDATLRALDRVEIYRPLIADPKAVRKQRADEGKAMKKGDGVK
ncbi:MAG: RnfH family protein [Azoarcus sp.]|jgi:putative ubiquitin-RnfH superfamily antitoxin RatB of RatAB toxin-antitoxin module|nr:RnfH family protein [Azoarcus sp.]